MPFALILDIIMIFMLGGTIFYVWRLSEQLTRFRSNRVELERLVRDLNQAVDRSHNAIAGMRETASTAGADLQKAIRGATELSDELQLMTESANSLASRLENAAGRSSGSGMATTNPETEQRASRIEDIFTGFSIRDPEFDGRASADTGVDEWDDDDLKSDAERDLMRAIEMNKKSRLKI